jgi:ABC-type transport system involved in multi-copper enzyme maturation permease subunit
MPKAVREEGTPALGHLAQGAPLSPPKVFANPSALGTLVLKEAHDLVLTLRFTVGTALTLVLAMLAAYIGSLDYNARLDSYQTKLKLNRQQVDQTAVYSYLRPTLIRPPEPLSILHHGLEGRLGTDFGIAVDTETSEPTGLNRGNEFLAIFSEVDLTIIVAVILGLLALLFTFDLVCGEREAGMLKLMMSYSVSRSQLLLGKYLGAWVTLMLPTTVACVLSVLVMGFAAQVRFGAQEIVRIGLIFFFYALYLSLMLLVGLVISSFVQRSSLALVFSTFVWFFLVAIVPNLATMLPDFVGSREQVYQQTMENLSQVDKEEEAAFKGLKGWWEGISVFHFAINNSSGDGLSYECHFGDQKMYDRMRDFYSQAIPMAMKLASRRAEIWRQYIRYRARQAALARVLSFLSPTAVFQNTLGYLSGTSQRDHEHFISLASQYRNTFVDYLQRKNAFNSWRWFTPDPYDGDGPWTLMAVGKTPDEMDASGKKPDDVITEWMHDQTAWRKFLQYEIDRDKKPERLLALGDLPAFTYQRFGTGAVLVQGAPEIGYLVVLNVVLFLVAFVRFLRYDVR